MKLSVYLGEDEIRTALGRSGKKIEIQDCCRIRLREGALINDIVTEEESVREVLREIRERNKKYRRQVYLMMGGNQIITKVLMVPRMSRRHMLELVRRELSDLILPSEESFYLYDYSVIRKRNRENKGRTILCVAIKRKVVTEYEKLFSECGLRVKAIDVAVDGINRLVDFLPSLRHKTFILSIADGRNLMTSLYINGVYTYTNRMRLVGERGTKECTEEMIQTIRSVIHFCKVQKEEFDLEFLCLCGLKEEEQDRMISGITESEEIEVRVPEPEGRIVTEGPLKYSMAEYMYVTGNLLNSRLCLNLISASKRKESRRKGEQFCMIAAWLLPAAIVCSFLGADLSNQIAVKKIRHEIEVLEQELSNHEQITELEEEEKLWEKWKVLQSYREGQEAVARESLKIPEMNSEVRNRILREENQVIEISEPEFVDGALRFEGRAVNYEEISPYVRRLEETGLFDSVEYMGFTNENPVSKEQDGNYYFQVTCGLSTKR